MTDAPLVPSPSQAQAIEAEPRSLLVLAGPGAGKTFCLTERIRFLIEHRGFDPARICAFTFTNKAAGEIALRLERRLGTGAERITRGTIHAFCADLLRKYATSAGLETGFGIADEEYQLNVLRRLEGPRRWHRQTLTRFSAYRFRGDEMMRNDAALFERYEAFLAARNLVDFDTLVIKAATLVEDTSVAPEIRARWNVVLVDEFQDLNPVQYRIVKALARDHRHVFAVGDDDQSIYWWAGADPTVFRQFVNDFNITDTKIHLGENHRCPQNVFALARKLVDVNQPIFSDREPPRADRAALYPVGVPWFETDEAEAAWLVDDVRRDREAHHHQWGDVALLFRKHDVGNLLETACINAGIPCRRAQGRSLADDPIVGYVIAAARVIQTPNDDVHREGFFHVVLPRAVFDEARAKAEDSRISLRSQLNRTVSQLPRGDSNRRDIYRALYDCDNLEAIGTQQPTLMALVQELLSRRVGRLRSLLDEHHDALTDPAGYPEVVALAGRLRAARAARRPVLVPPMNGADIAIKGMLDAINVRVVRGDDTGDSAPEVLSATDVPSLGLALGVFKAAQLLEMESSAVAFTDFTAVDLETTDSDITNAQIVEIAAVRVRNSMITETFTSLVKPNVRIHAEAAKVTGIHDADVADAPAFAAIWPAFREFVGSDVLVAHNGYEFDFPILKRMAQEIGEPFHPITFDSLPLARDLIPTSRKLPDLARHFEIDTGQSHRALDDTRALALVMQKLGTMKLARARKTALSDLLGHLGIALALSDDSTLNDEARLFRDKLTWIFVLGRYGHALDYYEEVRGADQSLPSREDVINKFGGTKRMDKLRTDKTADERYPAAMLRLRRLIADLDPGTLDQQLSQFLQRATLSKFDGEEPAHERVNLLTLHATKGLEFSRVYVIGCEDSQLPGGSPSKGPSAHEVEEGRRLLYVGMTRTIDRLVLTYCANRNGKPAGGHQFLDEMGLVPESPE